MVNDMENPLERNLDVELLLLLDVALLLLLGEQRILVELHLAGCQPWVVAHLDG